MISNSHKQVIGRSEPIVLVGVDGSEQIPAKVDSGAYRCALHCTDAHVVSKDGVDTLEATLLDGHPCNLGNSYKLSTDKFKQVTVSNSFGQEETRFEIPLKIKLGTKIFTTSFTLTDRSKKLFPILIGRKALDGRYLVDVNVSNIDRKALKDTYGSEIPDDEEDLSE